MEITEILITLQYEQSVHEKKKLVAYSTWYENISIVVKGKRRMKLSTQLNYKAQGLKATCCCIASSEGQSNTEKMWNKNIKKREEKGMHIALNRETCERGIKTDM